MSENPRKKPESYAPKKRPDIIEIVEDINKALEEDSEKVLTGIPHMGYGNPSAVCYIGSVMRLMDYLGDPIEADEVFALSGAGLCYPWKAGLPCDEISVLPDIPRRTFKALGYESEYFYEPDISKVTRATQTYSKEFYIDKIKNSIDAGRPVLGFGFTTLFFTCLITGYYNGGEGLYLRAYWSPKGTPEGYDKEKYYHTEEWYEKCHGIVVIGEKTGERLAGEMAYEHIKESARIFKEVNTVTQGNQTINQGAAAFDDMAAWLLDDGNWENVKDWGFVDLLLKPCGILLLNHYRWQLACYLERLSERFPGLVNSKIRPAIVHLCENVPGAHKSQLWLNECVDPAITEISALCDRSLREKVAAYVLRLKEMDAEIFAAILK